MKSLKKERTIATIVSWSTILIQVIVSLFFVPFFLNKVGDKQYGLYSFSSSIISWIDTLVIAFTSAYFKFLTRERKECGATGEANALGVFFKIFLIIFTISLFLGLGFDLLIYLKIIPLNEYSWDEVKKIVLIVLMSVISSGITSLLNVGKAYPYYKQRYIFSYAMPLLQVVLQTSLSILFLNLGFGVEIVALVHFGVMALISLIQMCFSCFVLKMKVNWFFRKNENKEYIKLLTKEIIIFTFFILLNTIIDIFTKNVDKILLGFTNADSVATYQLALSIPSYLISFTSIIAVVFSQSINNAYYNGGGLEEINSIYLKSSKIQTIVTFLLVGGYFSCGKNFVILWIGSERLSVYYITCILLALYSLTCSNSISVEARRATNNHRKAAFIYLGIAIFNVLISIFFILVFKKENAIYGCLLGTIFSYIVGQWIIMQIYDRKTIGLKTHLFFKDFAFYFLTVLPFSILITHCFDYFGFSNLITFIFKGLAFVFVYILFILIKENRFIKCLFKRGI